RTHAHTDSSGCPDDSGSGNPIDSLFVSEDHASAKKSDSRNDIGRDAIGIGNSEMSGDYREQRGAKRHQNQRAKTRTLGAVLPFSSNHTAQNDCQGDFEDVLLNQIDVHLVNMTHLDWRLLTAQIS